jgi:glucose-1-phosphate thymidylyltransferase
LGDGKDLGMRFEYVNQPSPDGLAQAFILGEEFLDGDDACLILGDNIFYGHGLTELLKKSVLNVEKNNKATIFGYYVSDPQRYGVAEFDGSGNVMSIEEKPQYPKSNYAVPGIYFYDNSVVEISKNLKPSTRGELEITDVNLEYLRRKQLKVMNMGRGVAWLDTGTIASLMQAAQFIEVIEQRQGLKIGCIEEIAYQMGFIDAAQLEQLGEKYKKSGYGEYLLRLLKMGY